MRASVEIVKGKKDFLALTGIFTLTNNKGYGTYWYPLFNIFFTVE